MRSLQNIPTALAQPEIHYHVTPSGNAVNVTTGSGSWQWPDLHTGTYVPTAGQPYTPYIGLSTNPRTGPRYHFHASGVMLTFSGVVRQTISGVNVIATKWDFGDGTTALATSLSGVAQHTYGNNVPLAISTSLNIAWDNGQTASATKFIIFG